MGFLAPAFLFGALAVGLPVYLHLLRRNTSTPQPFSSLMLFEPRQQSATRRRRLRYWLLLALRAGVCCCCWCSPSPSLMSRSWLPAGTADKLLLVVGRQFVQHAGRHSPGGRQA